MSFAVSSPPATYFYDAGSFSIEILDGCTRIRVSGGGAGGCGGVNTFAAGGGGSGAGDGEYDVAPTDWTSVSGRYLNVVVGAAADASNGGDTTLDAVLSGVTITAVASGGRKAVTVTPGAGGTASGWLENVAGTAGDDFSVDDAPGQGGAGGLAYIAANSNTDMDPSIGQGGRGSTSAPGGAAQDGKFEVTFYF